MPLQRVFRIALSALFVGLFLLHVTRIVEFGFISNIENFTYDVRLNYTLPKTKDPRIVIVDIDEKSLAELGRWPWPRNTMADIVNTLFDHYKIKLLGFDVVFAESDESSGLSVLETLSRGTLKNNLQFQEELKMLRPNLQHDQLFAQSLMGRKVVMGYYFNPNFTHRDQSNESVGKLPEPVARLEKAIQGRIPFAKAGGFGANLKDLQNSSYSAGFFDNPLVDNDGLFRRVPLVQEYNNAIYESLALSMLRLNFGSPKVELIVETGDGTDDSYFALEQIKIGDNYIPVDGEAAALVPYRGPGGSFPYVSAADVLNKTINKDILKDRLILVGTTAPGLLDLRSTPVQNVYPGVEVHANIISGVLDQRIMQRPAFTVGYEFMFVVLIGIMLTALLPFATPFWGALLTITTSLLVTAASMIAWSSFNTVLPMATLLLLTITMFILHMTYGYFVESRDKRVLTGLFGQYIPPELVEEMSQRPTNFGLEGESRNMTVLFSDVRNFTSISEGLDPKELTQLMNELLTPMTRAIHENRGTIDKYMGDCIMAFWGAPLPDPSHPRHALDAAFGILDALAVIREEFKKKGWPEINVGVGISSGEMNVGNMGSEFRMAYTVLGDTVNLGSRLEGLTKSYGVQIITSEPTVDAIPEYIFRELDKVRVKGKNKPVAIFEPLCLKEDIDKETRSELTRYKQALKLFRQQDWDNAEMEFFTLNRGDPDKFLYSLYLERIANYRNNPPGKDWDGVYTHTSK